MGLLHLIRRTMESLSEPTTTNCSETTLKMSTGAFYIPKERIGMPEGQDAHFTCEEKQTIGVSDGVGGWSDHGVDAGIYARNLMSNFVAALEKHPTYQNIDLMEILKQAYWETNDQGSSTACILTLKDTSLHCINVGDSGFMVLRNGVEFYKSPIHTKGFNHPYQLGKTADKPGVAKVSSLLVQAGDIVILGTDGLFDNLFTHDIQEIAKVWAEEGPEQVARSIAEYAYYNSNDTLVYTPLSEASFAAGKERYGGKKDDITVVVSFIING